MKRRDLLLLGLAFLLPSISLGHTPYRQWKVLRQRYLLVHSTRTNPAGDIIAEKLVEIFEEKLPKANARVARARHEQRAASLLTTGQAVLLVMKKKDAQNLFFGKGDFVGYKGKQIRALLIVNGQVLVTVESFSLRHVWLIIEALDHHSDGLSIEVPDENSIGIPVHQGALAYSRGEGIN